MNAIVICKLKMIAFKCLICQEEESIELTESEEAIKAYLEDNEPLPTHVLDNIIQVWWKSEPFK